ncbi:MAG: serine/threonine-protein kinase [Planctomycetes bacterium]|nr:serine/threonine-protein kinase [Planctomycetota bacterium]
MTRAGADRGSSSETPDDRIVDAAMEAFLRDLAAGRTPDVDAVALERPDLRPRIEAAWALAREISPPRIHAAAAEFPGYEIIRELGRGGMGQVLLAKDKRLGRLVALKVLPRRLASGRARERFEREARAVARLAHPLIVPVYEMGDADGQPYFTLQYVDGRTLAAAVESLRGREPGGLSGADFAFAAGVAGAPPDPWRGAWWQAATRAAIDIAEALAHAHSQGVVHRDVKPSNVMLRGDGFALLFDFGLADVEDEATLTQAHGFLGTPHYASPEQAAGETSSLDERSDVWSLGATLYEALTLQVPFPGPVAHEVLRRIQTWEPEAPSKLNPVVPRDLETVVLAALEKARSRRTPTARAFADDLRSVLAGKSVRARRAGVLERGLRMVKRNRALTELLVEQQSRNAELRSAVLRAERNEKLARESEAAARAAKAETEAALARAEIERDKFAQVHRFLQGMFESVDLEQRGRDARVFDVLERARRELSTAFQGNEETRAALQTTLGRAYTGLAEHAAADELLRAAVATFDRRLGPDHPDTLVAQDLLAVLLLQQGDAETAHRMLRDVAAAAVRTLRSDDPRRLDIEHDFVHAMWMDGHGAEALTFADALLPRAVDALGASHRVTLRVRQTRAILLDLFGRDRDGQDEMRVVWDARRETYGERDPETIDALASYAQFVKENDGPAAAAAHLEDVCRLAREVYGSNILATFGAIHNLAGLRIDLGEVDAAAALQEEVFEGATATLDATSATRVGVAGQLARIRALQGRFGEAEEILRTLRSAWKGRMAPGDRRAVHLSVDLAELMVRRGAAAEAMAELEATLGQPMSEEAAPMAAAASTLLERLRML